MHGIKRWVSAFQLGNNYDREVVDEVENIDADTAPKVLDMGFMGELKAAAVPDSDDECYFWVYLNFI